MDWAKDGPTWPNAEHSRFIDLGHRWHVQEAGSGETILLLHGAGGATQSWRSLFPILAERFHVVAPDLPGQGFTRMQTRLRCGLPAMSEDITALCMNQGWSPVAIVGHSAGAAIALELTRVFPEARIVGLNAALGKFDGVAGWLFPIIAKVMAVNPLVPPLLARIAGGEARARELLASTGSDIGAEGIALYRRLMSDSGHIDGTLAMMAQWNIGPLLDRLEEITSPVLLIVGTKDQTVLPEVSERAAARLPNARLQRVEGLGHLAHEEAAATVAEAILAFLTNSSFAAGRQASG